jgi:hypothetical protein
MNSADGEGEARYPNIQVWMSEEHKGAERKQEKG